MKHQDLEERLAQAISRTAPNDLEGVLSRCETQKCDMRKGSVIQMTNKKKSPVLRGLIAACLALALLGGGGSLYQQVFAVGSVVSLDVNPSIELKVNNREKVLACTGLNAEAEQVLADMAQGADLKGTKLDVAVNALVGALLRNGYLDSISSAILISVEDADQARAARLQQELTATVDGVLQAQAAGAAVLSQTLQKDSALEAQARENNISTGKAALIQRVQSLNSQLSFDALALLSVEELKELIEAGAPALPIGKAEALRMAMEYAGVLEQSSLFWEVDAELDEAQPHYDVELYTQFGEFDYDVDAYSGQVLRGQKDILQTKQPTESKPVESAPAQTPVESSPVADPPAESGEMIGEEAAFGIAQADFLARYAELSGDSAQNQRIHLDRDDGRSHYDVEFFLSAYEVDYEIDAYSGAILSWDTDYEGPRSSGEAPAAGDIGSEKAKAAALAHAGLSESQVSGIRVEQDRDDGRLEYEVEFRSGGMKYEYTIDAASGAILEHEQDRDD